MAGQYIFDDSEWNEVEIINGYAVFMGYLMMGVRGLGVLVVTWTTVVLLGGFVSDLGKKDFWCLTGITLVQIAGVFNFLLKEKLSDMVRSWWGLLFTLSTAAVKNDEKEPEETAKILMIILLAAIQGLVIGIILCPLGVVYLLGLYISAGVSFWRLIDHDFGDAGGANQKPALQVLYSLAVAQGVLFGYKTLYGLMSRIRLAKYVAKLGNVDEELVAEYLEKTVAGCERDPSFAMGRNLVTYGMDLMVETKSHEGFITGIRVLGEAIKDNWPRGRKVLAKYLLTTSDSSSHMIQRLLETVGPRCPYSREIREHAARIVALVARDIQLEQFPRGIECITSMLDTPEESNRQDSKFVRTSNNSCCYNKSRDYERVQLLEEYELDYLIYEWESPDSPDFSSRSLTDRLLQCLPGKRKTMESERKESRRQNKVHGFDALLVDCVNIIHQLAADENNRRIMSNTVLHKIARAPIKLHRDTHDLCSVSRNSELQILEKYWVLIEWLTATVNEINSQGQILKEGHPAGPSDAGGSSRENIEDEKEEGEQECLLRSMVGSTLGNAVINNIKGTIESIFDCLDCKVIQKNQGIQILLHLSLDMSFIMNSESRKRRLTWILLLILLSNDEEELKYWMISGFTDQNKNMCDLYRIKSLAREKLSGILREKHELPSEEREREFQLIHLALGDLSSAFADDAEDISIRTHATLIMEGLCVNYDPGLDSAKEVEGILMSAIPQVVKEILTHCASTSGDRRAEVTDIETGGVSQDGLLANRMCQDGHTDNERLRKALVSLCRDGYMGMFSSFGFKFVEIASKVCEEQGKSFKYFKSLLV